MQKSLKRRMAGMQFSPMLLQKNTILTGFCLGVWRDYEAFKPLAELLNLEDVLHDSSIICNDTAHKTGFRIALRPVFCVGAGWVCGRRSCNVLIVSGLLWPSPQAVLTILGMGPADGPVRAVGGWCGPRAVIVRSSYKSGLCRETSVER